MKNKKLTSFQKQFLLSFFENERFPGWKNIATTLLEEGSCTVAGKDCIWVGGIGNFIKTEENKSMVDCLLYKFDLKYFLSSAWYKDSHKRLVKQLLNEKKEAEQKYNDVLKLV